MQDHLHDETQYTEFRGHEVIDARGEKLGTVTDVVYDETANEPRLVVVDPAPKTCSLASEICAMVAEQGFWSLQAPVQRVASLMVNVPFSPALEKFVYPDTDKIIAAVKRTLA